jgi:hypothetical protein
MTKEYPNRDFQKRLTDLGIRCSLAWEEKGPKMTGIAWLSAYNVGGGICIVQSYKGGGWDVFTSLPVNDASASIADALARCGVKEHAEA